MNRKLFSIVAIVLPIVIGLAVYMSRMVKHGFSTRVAPSAMESSLATTGQKPSDRHKFGHRDTKGYVATSAKSR